MTASRSLLVIVIEALVIIYLRSHRAYMFELLHTQATWLRSTTRTNGGKWKKIEYCSWSLSYAGRTYDIPHLKYFPEEWIVSLLDCFSKLEFNAMHHSGTKHQLGDAQLQLNIRRHKKMSTGDDKPVLHTASQDHTLLQKGRGGVWIFAS